jgi:hypothetical protein
MTRRFCFAVVCSWIGIGFCAIAQAQPITAFWQRATITPEAIADDPQLANMQSWDLMTTTTGDWVFAGLRAQLPPGSYFYRHLSGSFKSPSPAAVAIAPALAFTTHVNTPNDDGLNNPNTLLLGGFKDEPMQLGEDTGVFSVSWGDLNADVPGTYQIARLTLPQEVLPSIEDHNPPPNTGQVLPHGSALIPNIPEPSTPAVLATLALLNGANLGRVGRHRMATPTK